MSERTFDDFDAFAKDYRTIHSENVKLSGADSFYFARMKVELLQQYEDNRPLRLLDIGCGDGATEQFIQQYFNQWQVAAIDISEKSIEEAKQLNLTNTSFAIYNGTDIPFEDDRFDIVFIAGVLHHVEYSLHDVIIQQVKRVLKKGGRLYLFEHNPLNPVTKYLVRTCIFDKDAKLLRSSYTNRLLGRHSLAVTKRSFIIFFPRKGILSKFIFLEKYLQWLPLGGQYFLKAVNN